MFLVSHYLLIYIYELFMIYCLYFVLCEIKKFFVFIQLVFSTHVFMRLLSVSGNIQVDSVVMLFTLTTDRQQLGWIFCVGQYFCSGLFLCNFEHLFSLCFVTDCQRGSLLGSKELGTNVLEFYFVMLANHDQNIFSLVQTCLKYMLFM